MSVVLRCPTCGTTQAEAGECEACSAGAVQYFCTNHPEGVWLDGPVCSRCGADVEHPGRDPRAAPPPLPPGRPAGAPDFRPPGHRRTPDRSSERDLDDVRRSPHEREETSGAEVLPPAPSFTDLIEAITDARTRARSRYEAADVPPLDRPAAPPGFPIVGCLVRTVGLVILLIVVAILTLLLLFGGLVIN